MTVASRFPICSAELQAHYSTGTHTINPAGGTLSVSVFTLSSISEKKTLSSSAMKRQLGFVLPSNVAAENTEKEGLAVSGTHRSASRAPVIH